MTVLSDAIEHLRGLEGVLDIFQMDDSLSNTIKHEEESTKSITQMDVNNIAYDEVMEKKYRIALIVDNRRFDPEMKEHSTVLMINSKGETVGKSLGDEEIEEYRPRDDVIWISKDFVIFAGSNFDGGEKFIIPAVPTALLDSVITCKNVVMAHPCTTSDMIIKGTVDFDLSKAASTIVLGFDD